MEELIPAQEQAIRLSPRDPQIGLFYSRIGPFYAFVGAVPADVVRARHRRIEAALSSPWVTHY